MYATDLSGYSHIGIYLSGYDRHVIYSPVNGVLKRITEIGSSAKNVAMIDFWNFFLYCYLGITPDLVDTSDNYTLVFEIEDLWGYTMYVAVISDKFVGNLKANVLVGSIVDGETKICTILRGSQVDMYTPGNYTIAVDRGDQVRINDFIGDY